MHSLDSSAVISRNLETPLGIERGITLAQPQAAVGYLADASPFARNALENFFHLPQGGSISLGPHRAGVLILDLMPARFQLLARTSARLAEYRAARSR